MSQAQRLQRDPKERQHPKLQQSFAVVGIPDVSQIVKKAMAKLGTPFHGEKGMREEIVGPPDDRMDFSDLDSGFYDLADTEKILRKLPKFIP